MKLCETLWDNSLDVEGDAEFVAWAATTFHSLVLVRAERAAQMRAAAERIEVSSRHARRSAAISELQHMLRRLTREFIDEAAK